MKMMIKILLVSVFLVAVAACRRSDMKTFTINVPDMKNRACATVVVQVLSATTGVQGGNGIKVDLVARTVTVTYESLITAKKNIEFAIADAGFSANGIPANPQAAGNLPPECLSEDLQINLQGDG